MSAPAWGTPAAIYALDKSAASICTRMQINGFAYDMARAREMAEYLKERELLALTKADDAVGRRIRRGKGGSLGTKDLQAAFFQDLKAPIYFRSIKTDRPSIGVDTLRAYAACADERLRALALAVIESRSIRKTRSTNIDRVLAQHPDGRVHPTWMNYGAMSGRWSCQGPNLMNLPRYENDPTRHMGPGCSVRSLYIAPPGRVLVSFDVSQLEMRVAAYASGDEAMIAACESSDLHATNAVIIFGDAFNATEYARLKEIKKLEGEQFKLYKLLKRLRTLAKTSGFAVCYLAVAETVYARLLADGVLVRLQEVEAMLSRLRRGFRGYFRWQDRRLAACIASGYTDEPVTGRSRWLGHVPAPPECANHPIQGGAAGLMNLKLLAIDARIRKECPGVLPVAQVHDSCVFECARGQVERVSQICKDAFAEPIEISSSGRVYRPTFPIELEMGERWS